jgi:hypothetical protein
LGQPRCAAVATVAHYPRVDLFEFRLALEAGLDQPWTLMSF